MLQEVRVHHRHERRRGAARLKHLPAAILHRFAEAAVLDLHTAKELPWQKGRRVRADVHLTADELPDGVDQVGSLGHLGSGLGA